jgi:hypothetical protein
MSDSLALYNTETCSSLVKSGFLPAHIKNPDQVKTIVLAGSELGLQPMQSLRSIVLVQGKVSMSAELILSLLKRAGVKHTWVRSDETGAVLKLERNGEEHTETFTIDDAKRAGLTSNPTWIKYPKAMCRARAVSAGARAFAPDVTLGIYETSEAQEIAASQTQTYDQPAGLSVRIGDAVAALPEYDPSIETADDLLLRFEADADSAESADALAKLEQATIANNQKILSSFPRHRDGMREYADQVREARGWDKPKRKPKPANDTVDQPAALQEPAFDVAAFSDFARSATTEEWNEGVKASFRKVPQKYKKQLVALYNELDAKHATAAIAAAINDVQIQFPVPESANAITITKHDADPLEEVF